MTYQTTKISDTRETSFVSETFKYRIIVNQVITGSEKQINYANDLKIQAMQVVDQFATGFIKKVLDNKKEGFETWRDTLLNAINVETDARQVLDKLADTRMDTETIMAIYNILPQQYI